MSSPSKKLGITSAALGSLLILIAGCDRSDLAVAPHTPPSLRTPSPVEAPLHGAPPEKEPTEDKTPRSEREATPSAREMAAEFRAASEAERRGELAADLWEIGTPEAVETLRHLFAGELNADVKADIVSGAADENRPELRNEVHALLLAALTPGQPHEIRSLAVHLLTEWNAPRAIALLQQFTQDADPQIREAAQEATQARKEKE
jgi:hypothetical protein